MLSFVTDFIYYNVIGCCLVTTSFLGIEYITDPQNFTKNIKSYSLNTLYFVANKVIELNIIYEDKLLPIYQKVKKTLCKNNRQNIKPVIIGKRKYNYRFCKENDAGYYVMDGVIDVMPSKPFIHFDVSYIDDNGNKKDICITNELNKFCVIGNIIDDDVINYIVSEKNPSKSKLIKKSKCYNYINKDCDIINATKLTCQVIGKKEIRHIFTLKEGNKGDKKDVYGVVYGVVDDDVDDDVNDDVNDDINDDDDKEDDEENENNEKLEIHDNE